jgi:hypothetical protein
VTAGGSEEPVRAVTAKSIRIWYGARSPRRRSRPRKVFDGHTLSGSTTAAALFGAREVARCCLFEQLRCDLHRTDLTVFVTQHARELL